MAEEKKFESALPALLTQLLGSSTTTRKGGESSTTTATNTAETDPLRQIFNNQLASSTPEGMAAMLQELFTTGAKQVPVLTQAYANSTGTRTTGNSGLQLALGELNKTLAGQAATLAMQQQQSTATTAGNIAQATKSTTQTQNSSGSTNRDQKGLGNPNAALLASLLGSGLNMADKKGMFKGLFGDKATAGAPLDFSKAIAANGNSLGTAGFTDDYSFMTNPATAGGGSALDLGSTAGFTDDYSFLTDSGVGALAGGIPFDAANFDFGSVEEPLNAVADGASDFIDFGEFFADGGLVDIKAVRAKQAAGYADGGVVRNRNNMGDPEVRQGQNSINTNVDMTAGNNLTPSAGRAANAELLTKLLRRSQALENTPEDSNTNVATVGMEGGDFGATASDAQGGMNALMGSMMGGVFGLAGALGASALGLGSLQGAASKAVAAAALNAAGFNSDGLAGQAAGENASGNDALSGFLALNANFGTGDSSSSGAADVGAMTAAGDLGGFGIGDGGGVSGDGGVGLGGGSGDAGGDLADGGHVQGKGTGISDSIHAKLSDGEFVVSADVVSTLGADFFENLQRQFHVPAANQQAIAMRR